MTGLSAAADDLHPSQFYRLPWSMTDNAISWLEPTISCNITCEGCYRLARPDGHKRIEEIARELDVFKRERKSDCMSIAGGEPLTHPKIENIVRLVHDMGWKPILITNGLTMTPERLRALKQAGLFGATYHVDTSQTRAGVRATTEAELNPLRQQYAEMMARERLVASFNLTVTADTATQIPDVVSWATRQPDKVHSVVFILFRSPKFASGFNFYAKGRPIDFDLTYRRTDWGGSTPLMTEEMIAAIRAAEPAFRPCAYLGGTQDPTHMKWAIGIRVASRTRTFGYASPRFIEVVQQASHLVRGRWLSYSSPSLLRMGKSASFAFATIDRGMRAIAGRILSSPSAWGRRVYMQSFTIIQPPDMLPDGRLDMCDGCPDMTVYDGKLFWKCRLEEVKEYGTFVTGAPRH
jgi:radical SAM family protein